MFTLASASVIALVYSLTSITVEDPDTNLAARNIETPYKLLLNGYLGLFFGFKYLGNINWLLLPLGLVYLIRNQFKLTKAKWALITFFFLAFCLIAVKGFFNFRYAFSLLPICIFTVFLLIDRLAVNKATAAAYSYVLLAFTLFGFQNEFSSDRVKRKINEVFFSSESSVQDEVDPKANIMVGDILQEISEREIEDWVLVNNQPDFYYHTRQKGLYYWSGDDFYFDQNGRAKLFGGRSDVEVLEVLKSRACTHVYTHLHYEGYNEDFDQFLITNCELILEDPRGRQLYKILYEEDSGQ